MHVKCMYSPRKPLGRANCCDHATMESFGSTLKLIPAYRRAFTTRKQARTEIFDDIENLPPPPARHTALGHLSPH